MIIGFIGGKEVFVRGNVSIGELSEWPELMGFVDYADRPVVVRTSTITYIITEKGR